MQPREFITPAHMVVGSDAVAQLGEQCRKRGWRKALIVTDKIMASLGLVARVEQQLAGSEIGSAVYAGVNSEPVVEYVQEGLEIYREQGCDFVVAVGGGSPIDAAKAIAVLVTNLAQLSNIRARANLRCPACR